MAGPDPLVGTTFRPCLVVASRLAVAAPVAVWSVETQNGEHQPSGEVNININYYCESLT